jgi:biotin-(acetyl-CoA carboxylase) ligase
VTPDELGRALEGAAARLGPFTQVEFLAETGSTNDIALQRAQAGAPHGTVVLADMQTAGRGRRGRDWHSPPEAGVYLSAVLRAEAWDGALSLLTLAAGVAVAQAIRSNTGLAVELKWPNDIVIGRPWRKLAGILCETASATPKIGAVVVGIGVNVRGGAFPQEIADRATALDVELGRPRPIYHRTSRGTGRRHQQLAPRRRQRHRRHMAVDRERGTRWRACSLE